MKILDISDVKELSDLKHVISLSGVKLLERPIIILNNTILKVICNRDLKCSLKKIEKLLDISFRININFDLNTQQDYYELILNKKISKIINQLNIHNLYNIGVKLLVEDKCWILHSIEIADYEDDDEIVDYPEIFEDLLLKTNVRINSMNTEINLSKTNLDKLNELKNNLENNFKTNEIENYYKLLQIITN